MELDELTARLRNATKDKLPGSRFAAASDNANMGAGSAERDPPPYRNSNSNSNSHGIGGDSDSDLDEDDIWGAKLAAAGDDSGEEDEDIAAREEELKDQLSMATVRCETLKKNLLDTVSFARSFSDDSPAMRPQAAIGGGGAGVAARISEKIVSASHDIDPEDDDLYDGTESDDDVYPVRQVDDRSLGLGVALSGVPPRIERSNSTGSEGDTDKTPRKGQKPSLAVKVSPYAGLEDAPSPSGKLGERIARLRQRCVEALGRSAFEDAYLYLQEHDEVQGMDEEFETEKKRRMRAILGDGKAHYAPLIEQLLFMEMSHCG
jgi:hypothetical protein